MGALQLIPHIVQKPATASGHQPALTAVPGDLTLWRPTCGAWSMRPVPANPVLVYV